MAKSNLQEKLAGDKEFKLLTQKRDELSQSLRTLRRTLGDREDSYTFNITACGAAFAAAVTCFSLAHLAIVAALGAVALAGAVYTGYQSYVIHKELSHLRNNADHVQSEYEHARDAVRDYAFSNIKTNGTSEKTVEPEVSTQPQRSPQATPAETIPAASAQLQGRMELEKLAESLVKRH